MKNLGKKEGNLESRRFVRVGKQEAREKELKEKQEEVAKKGFLDWVLVSV